MAHKHLIKEVSIMWAFNYRDLTATVLPASFFTIASSLESKAPLISLVSNITKSAILSFLLLYTFTISNQINGIEEDRLNKPDRPIVSGRVSLWGAYARYFMISIGALVLSRGMRVEAGAIIFMLIGAVHNFTKLSSFGPAKDLLTTCVLLGGLYSAWQLGGGNRRKGVEWIACIAANMLSSISVQDLRDIVGDAATGRRTTPLMLGKPYDRVYIAVGMMSARILTLPKQYLQSDNAFASKLCAMLVVTADLYLVTRMFRVQGIIEDKKTYRLYMIKYSFELLCSIFVLSA